MYGLKDLIEKYEVIWFSVGSDKGLRVQFLKELNELDLTWIGGDPICENDFCSYFMGISSGRKVGHVSWQIWRATWLSEEENPNNRERFYSDSALGVARPGGDDRRGEVDYLV